VYINLKYTSGGQLKSHPADLILVLHDECIVVSVKVLTASQSQRKS
jgi:hypothetical protein